MSDLGTWSRTEPLSASQMRARQRLFVKLQKEYNDTHDKNILWFEMSPLILDSVKSSVIKMNGGYGHFIPNYEEKVDKAYMLLIARYVKNPDYNFHSLPTLTYWAAKYSSRNAEIIYYDKMDSYERLTEETLLHEDEHIIEMCDSNNDSDNWEDFL